jgi:tetratricopeptide (TPR) repeat protein
MNFDRKKIFCFSFVFVVLIGVYSYTIAPTASLWDCGEFIACSHILGVPHPPGTPFYILLGRLFDIFLPFNEVAKRVNFLSVLSGAIAGAVLYLVILKVLGRFKENRDKELSLGSHLIAAFSAIGADLCFSVWDSAVEAEVYATSVLILTLGLWLTLLWSENIRREGDNNYLLLLVYLISLSIGISLEPLLLIPGVLLFLILTNWKVLKNPRFIGLALFLFLAGVSTYLVLMIRAHASPAINEVDPTTFSKLWEVFSRKQYGSMSLFPRHTAMETGLGVIPAFIEQLKVYFKYFSWQFFPYPRASTGILLRYLSVFGTYIYVLIGIWGMWVHFKKDKESFWLFFILYILLSLGLVVYLNHEFSPSDPNPAHQPREPRERDYFWSSSFFLFMFYVSIGLYWIWGWLRKKNQSYAWGLVVLSGIIGFFPFISNIDSHANRRGVWIAHDYANNLLVSPDDNSILFTYGDNDTFPVWFLQEVKNFRKFDSQKKTGVRLGNFSLMNTRWYIKELKEAGIPMDFATPFMHTRFWYEYKREKQIGRTDKDFEEWLIDTIPGAMVLRDGGIIELKDMAVKSIILCAIGKKPSMEDIFMKLDLFAEKYVNNEDFNPSINIYFSSPLPTDYRNAFKEHLLQEGLAYKLVKRKVDFKSNREKTMDLFINKFAYSYYDNFWANLESEAQITTLLNLAVTLFSFNDEIFSGIYPDLRRGKITGPVEDTLKMLESLYRRVIIYAENDGLFFHMAVNLIGAQKLIYEKLNDYDEGLRFANSFLQVKDVPRLHFLRGELLVSKAGSTEHKEEAENMLALAEDDFNRLLSMEGWNSFAYKGLVETYVASGEEENLENLIDKLLGEEKVFAEVFMLLRGDNIESAIELTRRVKNRFPDDRNIDKALESLRAEKREMESRSMRR